jgi:hypothetical protein
VEERGERKVTDVSKTTRNFPAQNLRVASRKGPSPKLSSVISKLGKSNPGVTFVGSAVMRESS